MHHKKIKNIGIIWENLEFGGVTIFLENIILSKSFSKVGFTIITNNSNPDIEKLKKKFKKFNLLFVKFKSLNTIKFENFFLKLIYLALRPIFFIATIIQLYLVLRKFKFDIFLANCGGYGNFRSDVAGILSAKLLKYKNIILLIHHSHTKPYLWKFLIDYIDKIVSKNISALIFVSKATFLNIKKKTNLLKKKNIYKIIYSGILTKFNLKDNKSNKTLGLIFKDNKNLIKIGMISRVEKNKGHEDLIEAVELLPKKYKKQIKIFLIGPGQEKYIKFLKKIIFEKKLQNYFVFTGYIDVNAYSILKNIDLYLSLTRDFEGFGISTAQALFMQKPIVATNVGAISEYLNNKNARLIKPNNIHEIKKSIINFLNQPETFIEKAKGGKELIKNNFNAEKQSKKYFSFLETIFNNNSKKFIIKNVSNKGV